MTELKEKIKNKEVVIGTDRVLKKLRTGKLSKIYFSSNCPAHTKDDIEHYARLHNIQIKQSKKTNEGLGILCKKPFSVSVLGY
ncbi:MAG: ribosomal L7Ae/L30e/S12e/Gadd45 family protein [Nanoarchaeota archaeon]|nr:ribosomal L7Ae/L30e/S12e/Gadd45 family protein [Nanoarchaeota archaeon]